MTTSNARRLLGATIAAGLVMASGTVGVLAPVVQAAPTASGSISGGGYGATPRSGVFRDVDSDGTWDAGEPGQAGITVTATCVADTGTDAGTFDDVYGPVSSTTTATDGSYTLSGADVRGLCRVEFAIPAALQTFLQPGVATTAVTAPNSAGTHVQFVDATLNPTVTTAVHNPADYTGTSSTPDVATGRGIPGAASAASNDIGATYDTVYRTDYGLGTPTALAQGEDSGSIWGIAWEPATETVFASAVVKRHSGLLSGGPDAIYAYGPNIPAGWSTPFTAVDTDAGAVGTDAARGLGNGSAPSDDDDAFAQAGTLGWGDLDISEDGRTLYAVNLKDKTVQPIDIATKTAGTALTIPTPNCTNGAARPWGLEVNDGLIYAGVVCDAATGAAADLAAFVYAYNPNSVTLPLGGVPAGLAAATWSGNLIGGATTGIPLDYAKGCAIGTNGCQWNPWEFTYVNSEFNTPGWAAIRPQPMLTDIEVDDDGSLLLAFADRVGFQFGYRNRRPQSTDQSANIEGVISGDILRAVPSGTGTFTLENDGVIARGAALGGGTITGNTTNDQGPGGGEVYSREVFTGAGHSETSLGTLAKVAGRNDYLLSIMDPFDTDSGGIGTFPIDGSARTDAIELYDSTAASGGLGYGFGKGSGLADVEVLTQFAPVEVGNRVWRDDNGNGIQDAGEPPIAGVVVDLVIDTTTYQATTDATGQYLFSSVARTGATTAALLAGAQYRFTAADDAATIRIVNATGASQQAALAGLAPTEANDATANAPNVAGSNASDSDGVLGGTTAQVTFTLGSLTGTNDTNASAGDSIDREGYNRHIYDFGFVPVVSLGNRVWFDTDNDSTLDATEVSVSGVAVQLFFDSNASGAIDAGEQTPVAYDTTDANGLYYFDQFTDTSGAPLATPRLLSPGNYVVGVTPGNFTGAGVLVGYHSSATSISAAGVASETTAPDPDDDVNTDDNGTRQTGGFYAGGVLSSPVTITAGGEPTAEEVGVFDNRIAGVPDANSNLTVDFGFYTSSVGNTVWLDDGRGGGDDDDGVQNGGEIGVANVPVRLFASDGTTEIPVGPDGILGTADDATGGVLTGPSGTYLFAGLPEGTYLTRITAPGGFRSSTDPANVATPLASDLDDNGAGVGTGTISSSTFLIDAGVAANGNVITNASGRTTNPRVDFGLVQSYDLTIEKAVTSTGPYVAGAPVTYTLVASNLGPGIALDGLTVTDRLPAGLTHATPVAASGSEWTCAAPVGLEVTCTWVGANAGLGNDFLGLGASAPVITVNAVVVTPAPTPMVNVAVVEPSPNQSIPETIPVGTNPDRYEDGNPGTGSNNDDSGSIPPGPVYSLGDLVWIDADRDGVFDATETPIAGVQVRLLDAAGDPALDAYGDPVPATVTGVGGRYQFDLLATGDYRVEFTLPSGYVWTASNTGADDGIDSDAVPATATSATATTNIVTLTDTAVVDSDPTGNGRPVTDPTIDAGVVPLVSLGDLVWIDDDGDGQFDPAETPVDNVTVELRNATDTGPALDPLGAAVPSVSTDLDGRYEFTGLLPGDYRVRFTLPSGFAWTVSNTGGDGLDSDPTYTSRTQATATTGVVTLSTVPVVDSDTTGLARVVTDPTVDAGVVPIVSLGDLVWIDADQNGQFDLGEAPLAGVTVTLLDGAGDPALDAAGNTVADTSTNALGRYEFGNLVPGDYIVEFTLPTNYAWTTSNTGADGTDSDATFVDPLDLRAQTNVVTLTATPVADTDPTGNGRAVTDPTIDAGVIPLVSLGDVVWIDADRDGQYGAAEAPAASVTVRLLDALGAPAVGADGLPVADEITDADGRYSFVDLLPGEYVVEFVLPTSYAWTLADQGADDGQDSDALFASTTQATARTAIVTLTSTTVPDTDGRGSARAVTNPTLDAGIVPVLSLGDVVWIDDDRDGAYDATESPIAGVAVALTTAAGGAVTDASGNTVGPTSTDSDGRYSFSNLLPGGYRVVFTLPSDYQWTSANQGADDGQDSDALFANANQATATTAVVTLTNTPVADTDGRPSARPVTNPTIDAGVVPILSLGDLVWIDDDRDGQYAPGVEAPIAGVAVALTTAAGGAVTDAFGATVAPTTTDVDGRYSFDGLLPGSYRVVFTLPSGHVWTVDNTGGDSLDSDPIAASPTAATATTAPISLTSVGVVDADPDGLNVTNPTIDAGVVPLVSVGDLVWVDADGDGQYDTGSESPLAGVTVTLLDGAGDPARNASGVLVPAVVTDVNGRYSFTNLVTGDYEVVFALPSGYVWTVDNTGGDVLDSDAVAAAIDAPTASTGVVTITSTPVADLDPAGRPVTNPTLDAGVTPLVSLGDLVWVDTDRDGQYDIGTESPLAGVVVALLDGAGAPASDAFGNPQFTITDLNGRYSFDDLLPGDYRVRFTLPAGHVWTVDNTGGDGLDSDPIAATNTSATATTAVIALTATAVVDPDTGGLAVTNPTIDAGVVPVLSLGDLVWIDEDGDGQYDVGTELPLAGVTVRLLTAAGDPATDAAGNLVSDTTDPAGRYSFANLFPGTYRVEFTLPGAYVWTDANTGGDGLDSDAVPASPGAPTATTNVVTLSSNPVVDPDPDGLDLTNPTVDAGVVPLLSLGDLVWIDADRDGQYDVGIESPRSGVAVRLLTAAGAPATDAFGNPVSDTTDAAGRYSFSNLVPGDYRVEFTLPTGFVWTIDNAGADDGLDSDPIAGSPGASTATTGVVTLTSTPVADSDPDGLTLTNPTVDAGLVPLVSLGDLVWVDADGDGQYDVGVELPLPGVTVRLLDEGGNPANDALGAPVAAATTDADGRYSFTGLLPSAYFVEFTLPAGYLWTDPDVGGDTLDSDADFGANDDPVASTGLFTLSATPVPDTDPDGLAVTNPTIDAGVVPLVSLGDLVWIDTDRDGQYDVATELPLAGVSVRLLDDLGAPATDAFGNTVADVTDAAGRYSFVDLLPGDYTVEFTLPAGYVWTLDNTGADGLDSDAVAANIDDATAVTTVITLTATPVSDPDPDGLDVTHPTVDAGVVPRLSLGDLVWIDADGDGQYDVGTELPLAGVTVTLLDGAGDPAVDLFGFPQTTTTDVDGRYSFDSLAPGNYSVEFTLPAGFVWTTSNTGGDVLDSDAVAATRDAATARTGIVALTSTPVADTDPDGLPVTNPTIDAGVVPVVSLGDLVWIDDDRDGVFDSGVEDPIAGVTVSLQTGAGGPVTDALGAPVAPTVTDASGRYSFEGLVPGTYRVEFTLPAGYVWTTANVGGNGSDGLDSDAVPAAADAATARTAPFVLADTPVLDADPGGLAVTDPTIDAGVVPVLSLGDLVWIDDGDGIYEPATELPFEGATVTLLDDAGAPALDALGNPVAATTTDVDGRYSFTNLLPGDYQVVFTLPPGHAWTADLQGPDTSLDSDAVAGTPFDPTASSGVFTLSSTPVADSDAAGLSLTNPTVDAGIVPVLSLGDLVWIDEDRDGQYDVGVELPVVGAVVRLTDAAGDPVDDAAGNPVGAATTDADGRYFFTDLVPGTYRVEFDLPAGFVWTSPNTGGDGLDSDAVPGSPAAPTAVTNPFVLSPTPVADPDTDGLAVTNPTIDAGVVPVVSLGDAVWIDTDNDGVYDPSEDGIANVAVRLVDAAGNPVTDADGNPVGPTTTDPNGRYQFGNLLPGQYRVVFTLPPNYAWSPPNVGADDGVDSDAVPATRTAPTATTGVITLTSTPVTDTDTDTVNRRAVTNPTIDAGVVPVVSLGDLVWVDLDGDGAFDPTEAPLPGATVRLLNAAGAPATDVDGAAVPTATTDANGRYQFGNLLPGSYRVQFTVPAGFAFTTPNAGGDDSLDSDAVPATPNALTATTGVIVLTPTAVSSNDTSPFVRNVTNPTVDAGVRPVVSVGDLVWFDADRDGQFDPTEAPAPGITVTLLTGGGAPATDVTGASVPAATTDANGRYSFTNLAPGDYRIVFNLPVGAVWTTPNTGSDGLDSDAVSATPTSATASTGVITLTSTPIADTDTNTNRRAVTNPTLDAGLVPLVAVGDIVWRDSDNDGIQDPGEPPVAGVTVTLLNPDGTPARDANGNLVPPQTTGSNGRYLFDSLLPGSYVIVFGNIPSGFQLTTQGSGGGVDSNPSATTGRTPVFTLTPGDPDLRPVGPGDPTTSASFINPTIDAGIFDPRVDGSVPTTTTVPPTTRPLPALPSTGSDVGHIAQIALLALLAGVAFVVASRRRGPTTR